MMTSSLVALVVAFGSPSDFAAPSVFGGGGGLRFTGSPREKWDCGVCHVSEQPHTFTVVATGRDLATQGYVPGERYELEVETATPGKKNAFALEFTNRSGDPAGVVSVDPQTPHLCTSLTPEPVDPVEVIEGRVAMTYACEVAKWRVVWTAPAQDDGVVTLYASLVEGNGEDGSRGDVATTLVLGIPSPSTVGLRSSGCSSVPGSAMVLLAWTVVVVLRHRKRREIALTAGRTVACHARCLTARAVGEARFVASQTALTVGEVRIVARRLIAPAVGGIVRSVARHVRRVGAWWTGCAPEGSLPRFPWTSSSAPVRRRVRFGTLAAVVVALVAAPVWAKKKKPAAKPPPPPPALVTPAPPPEPVAPAPTVSPAPAPAPSVVAAVPTEAPMEVRAPVDTSSAPPALELDARIGFGHRTLALSSLSFATPFRVAFPYFTGAGSVTFFPFRLLRAPALEGLHLQFVYTVGWAVQGLGVGSALVLPSDAVATVGYRLAFANVELAPRAVYRMLIGGVERNALFDDAMFQSVGGELSVAVRFGALSVQLAPRAGYVFDAGEQAVVAYGRNRGGLVWGGTAGVSFSLTTHLVLSAVYQLTVTRAGLGGRGSRDLEALSFADTIHGGTVSLSLLR